MAEPKLAAWAWPHRADSGADKAIFVARGHVLELVSAALAPANLQALLAKGVGLAHLYPSPWLRPMADIDLLVRTRDLDAVTAALAAAGFSVERDLERPRTGSLLEVAVRPPTNAMQLLLELHVAMDKAVLRPVHIDGVFARSAAHDALPQLRIPTLEDHVLLVALHLAADEYRHAAGFADLEVLITAGADLEIVVARAKQARASAALYVAFATLEHLLPGFVPPETLAALRPGSAHEALLRTTFDIGAWPVAKRPTKLGAQWLLGQWLLQDDATPFAVGLASYLGKRVLERMAQAATVLRRDR